MACRTVARYDAPVYALLMILAVIFLMAMMAVRLPRTIRHDRLGK